MKSYGQFCSIARALDLLGERWTLLIVRELFCGSRRFGDVRRGIPRISPTMLSARLRELIDASGRAGVRYLLRRRSEVSLCTVNPGFPEAVQVRAPLRTLTGW